ncbi:MFS general substrate transporter [Cylindrobasidium torrendii FP15055 ss-10]|uniref:MFS general substrate transporter n=1 Tax=Cylindrobasidium torrendii FP15055 ss-10 TaxID=1314674 RepID=A0A0D7BPE0_9AGAR|nr:MFS general substrate transporter [Cylindrobasidium torrendii FP15055 ss-10]
MVADILRDSFIGQFINSASKGKYLPYADQRQSYVVAPRHLPSNANSRTRISAFSSRTPTLCGDESKKSSPRPDLTRENTLVVDPEKASAKQEDSVSVDDDESDPYLVDWDGDDDQDNPRNWSPKKRAFVAFLISFLTFSVYIGSAIYTPSIPGLMEDYNASLTYATLGLTLYVIGYGVGPMFLTPFQDLAQYGRNAVYIPTLAIFLIFQIPIVTATNIRTVLAFRFLTGFFGSPALATGGASMCDIYNKRQEPYVIGIWALGAVAGPITGPVIGGFAAQANGWRWPQYELLWISGFSLLCLSFLLPETYGPTILLKRAQRLRKLTGNEQLRTQTEKDTEGETVLQVLAEALYRPIALALEPVLLFANIYIGFVYAIFYLWFESFPIVFTDIHHFNLGLSGLPFLGFVISGAITYTAYCFYLSYYIDPRSRAAEAAGGELQPEIRLEIGLIASIFIPISVLIFGFTAREDIHWIVPIIGAALYLPGIYLNFQSVLTYITSAYPDHQAAVLAGNDLARSVIASVFPLFGHAYFTNLGLGPASAILAGISVALWIVFAALRKWGHVLRRRSKYAATTV